MKDTDGKITNDDLLDLVHNLSESKLDSDIRISNSIDTKASWIILFLGTIIAIIFQSKLDGIYIITSIIFTLSIAFSLVVIRPRDLKLGINLYGLTKKYWDKNESKKQLLEEIVGNVNDSVDSNKKLIKLKSKWLRVSLIMLSIGIGILVIYTTFMYFYSLIISECLKTIS